MAEYNLSNATTTNYTDNVPNFIQEAVALDAAQTKGETYWYFPYAAENFGYYFKNPKLKSSIDILMIWAFGRGYDTLGDVQLLKELDHITGAGDETFNELAWNHGVTKKVVGDAFIEIKKDKDSNTLINLIAVSPERVRMVFQDGRLKRYDVYNLEKGWRPVEKKNMIHSMNDKIGDSMHGTSLVDSVKWILDAENEAMRDHRLIKHRDKALGIAYYKTGNVGKITFVNSKIEEAVKNGEMLGLPEGTVELKEFPGKQTGDRLEWLRYLDGLFYQVTRIPRSIVTSDGLSEVGGKMGHVIFEPIYVKEQLDFEGDLWGQAAIQIKYNRPPSLGGLVQQDEEKNTGQTGFQNNDAVASMTRE